MSKQNVVPTQSVYRTECHRRIVDDETGEERVVILSEDRQVNVTLSVVDKAVFWKGARVA